MAGSHTREKRFPCHGKASLFLADKSGGQALTDRLHGQLLDISNHGASMALDEIITDRLHMAYTPMESDRYSLHIVLYLGEEEYICLVQTTWFNKKLGAEEMPFRIGMEFHEPLTSEQLRAIRNQS